LKLTRYDKIKRRVLTIEQESKSDEHDIKYR